MSGSPLYQATGKRTVKVRGHAADKNKTIRLRRWLSSAGPYCRDLA